MPAPRPHHATPCDGLLLSGGRGERVGGRDKGLLPTATGCAAQRALDTLRPLCRRLYVSANRNLARYRTLPDVTVVPDLRAGFAGPLAALESVATLPLAPLLLVLPNDLPLLDPAVPKRLLEAMREAGPGIDGVYASNGEHDQYLCICLRSGCLASAGAQLDRGDHRVRSWLAGWSVRAEKFTGAAGKSLRNFNDPADWAELD